jgi:hypothetical protein
LDDAPAPRASRALSAELVPGDVVAGAAEREELAMAAALDDPSAIHAADLATMNWSCLPIDSPNRSISIWQPARLAPEC